MQINIWDIPQNIQIERRSIEKIKKAEKLGCVYLSRSLHTCKKSAIDISMC